MQIELKSDIKETIDILNKVIQENPKVKNTYINGIDFTPVVLPLFLRFFEKALELGLERLDRYYFEIGMNGTLKLRLYTNSTEEDQNDPMRQKRFYYFWENFYMLSDAVYAWQFVDKEAKTMPAFYGKESLEPWTD